MKNLILLIIFIAGIFAACSDYDYVKPQIIKFTAAPTEIKVTDTVNFHIEYAGNSAVLWYGVTGKSDYDAYIKQTTNITDSTNKNDVPQANKGLIITDPDISVAFFKTGHFKAVLVVNSVSKFGDKIETVLDSSIHITVTK